MTDQAKISALAAELERLGKMPEWIGCGPKNTWAIFEDGTTETVLREDAVLAALSGVAAEVTMKNGLHIAYFGVSCKWKVNRRGFGFETIHEALIAALKQIEKEQKS